MERGKKRKKKKKKEAGGKIDIFGQYVRKRRGRQSIHIGTIWLIIRVLGREKKRGKKKGGGGARFLANGSITPWKGEKIRASDHDYRVRRRAKEKKGKEGSSGLLRLHFLSPFEEIRGKKRRREEGGKGKGRKEFYTIFLRMEKTVRKKISA